jgi:hypothetical protein
VNLFGSDTLVIEQPWTVFSLLWRPRYEIEVYDERDVPIAKVVDQKKPGVLKSLVRWTGFSGLTAYTLRVTVPGGPDALVIRKGWGKPATRVFAPDGTLLGSVRRLRRPTAYALLDPSGSQLCLLGDVASLHLDTRVKRNGKRVRRDVLRIRPGTPQPLRSLAVAAGVAFDVVRGIGTGHATFGGVDWPA